MTALVLGSILIYSLYLPQAAPKQITLAVLPFADNDEFTPLGVGFSSALRDSVALSRDVAVVDAVSTNAVMWDSEKASGMSHILALTHFVDGSLVSTDDNIERIEFRLVNVSQPNWKEVLAGSVEVGQDSATPLQLARDDITLQVRKALYDNSALRTESHQYNAQDYREYAFAVGSWFLDYKESSLLSELHESFVERSSKLYKRLDIATDPNRLFWNATAKFQETGDIGQYADTVASLASEYPNSLAVQALGDLAYDLTKWELAEHAWLRVARVQPQSTFVALDIANVRRIQSDIEGMVQAFRIAELRDDLQIAEYFQQLVQPDGKLAPPSQHLNLALFESLAHAANNWSANDLILEAYIHEGVLCSRPLVDSATARLWREPPLFMSIDDPRWHEAKPCLADRISSARIELDENQIPLSLEKDEIEQLFAPQRAD